MGAWCCQQQDWVSGHCRFSELADGCFQPKQLLSGISLSPLSAAKLLRPR